MSFLDRVAGIIGFDTSTGEESALTAAYAKCVQRAAQLGQHAEVAPQESAATALRALASAEEAQAHRLRDLMASLHISTALSVTPPTLDGTLNHWGRLVQDLEAHRRSVQEYRELGMRLAEVAPDTAKLFDTLCHEEYAHCEGLRDLIARADPQALN